MRCEPRVGTRGGRGLPRRSGAGGNTIAVTFTGHKEDRLVKDISEAIAAGLRKNVVVTAGMHWDTLAPRDLVMVQALAQKLAHKICRGIARRSQHARSTR